MPQVIKQTLKKKPKQLLSILDRIQEVEFDDKEGIKIALYGRSGTGKTSLWGTFPDKILAILCSGGTKSGELRSLDAITRKKVDQVVLDNPAEFPEIIAHVRTSRKYSTVVLDHGTNFQDLVLAKGVLGIDEIPAQKGWGLATQQQYGQCTLQCKTYLREMLNLSCNVVIIAQERGFETDGDNEIAIPYVGAALSPSLTGWLNQSVEYICQTYIRQKEEKQTVTVAGKSITKMVKSKDVEYCLRTAPHEIFQTKFRVPKSYKKPEVIVDPSYEKIMKIIEGKPV